MQQYEYLSFSLDHAGLQSSHGDKALESLNEQGKEGWEMVSATFIPCTSVHGQIDAYRSVIIYHMKRPLQSSTPFR